MPVIVQKRLQGDRHQRHATAEAISRQYINVAFLSLSKKKGYLFTWTILSLSPKANSISSRELVKALAQNWGDPRFLALRSTTESEPVARWCQQSPLAVRLRGILSLGFSPCHLLEMGTFTSKKDKILEGNYTGRQSAFLYWCNGDSSKI